MTLEYIQQAARAAEKSRMLVDTYKKNKPVYHIGCVIVYNGKIISSGYNCNKTNPLQRKYNVHRVFSNPNHPAYTPDYIHAEISALCALYDRKDINWSRVKVYICRINKSGDFRLVTPCKACMAALRELGIKRIYCTTNDGEIVRYYGSAC